MSFRLLARSATRNLQIINKNVTLSRSLTKVANVNTYRTFVSSPVFKNQLSLNIADILSSEKKLETDALKAIDNSTSVFNEYLEKYNFELLERSGKNLNEIIKATEDETIRVFFDVAQVANLPYDPAMNREASEANGEELINEEDFDSLSDKFANVNVVITKNNDKSAVSFELLMNLAEGSFYVDSVTPYKTEAEALDESAESEVSRELVYHGPPFSNLDEELQESLEVYLESRGITSDLSTFITSYSEYKENVEYINWLGSMQKYFGN